MIPRETRERAFDGLGIVGSVRAEWDYYFDVLEGVFFDDQSKRLRQTTDQKSKEV